MTVEVTYPGVYVEEIPSGVHTIQGVATSTAAFVGATKSGPADTAVLVRSFNEFTNQFGGLSEPHPLSYAVQQYFVNGGREALIARVVPAGAALTDADVSDAALAAQKRGLWLLDHAERFNILCIPPLTRSADVSAVTWSAAIAYAERRGAMLIMDPPAAWTSVTHAVNGRAAFSSANAALYFPRLQAADPLRGNQLASFPPCGAIAGLYARIDNARGVWKAPAGLEAKIPGASGLSVALTDTQNGALNEKSINALRKQPDGSLVAWGARTLASDSQWKYVPVRRTSLYIEQSLQEGLRWTVFEPNDEPLWAQVRQAIENFLHGLWRSGAFQGAKPEDAYFVRCDRTTMNQNDIDNGRLIVIVGFAPLQPAEFVILGGTFAAGGGGATMLQQRLGFSVARYSLGVSWDGALIAGVTAVRGLAQRNELITQCDGADPGAARLSLGRASYDQVTLVRGLTQDDAFAAWAKAARAGGSPRKEVHIEIHDRERGRMMIWRLIGALPVKHDAPDLSAKGTDVAIEELVLAYEGVELG
jgi:phage tail-like protein